MRNKKRSSAVQAAARVYGCEVGDLMAYHEFEDGSVAIIAPSGQKFIYSADQLAQEMMKAAEPGPATAAARQEDKGVAAPSPQEQQVSKVSEDAAARADNKRSSKGSRRVEEG